MRMEEFIAYFFFIPCLAITMRANFHFWLEGYGHGRRIVERSMANCNSRATNAIDSLFGSKGRMAHDFLPLSEIHCHF